MISIVIPTYNRSRSLKDVLDSVLAQTAREWECLVVDDGSTDDSFSVISNYTNRDNRFVYINNTRRKGAQGARNSGILAARGGWICLFDSDDVMYPDYVEKMERAINEIDADVFVCYAFIRNIHNKSICGRLDNVKTEGLHKRLLKETSYLAYDVCVIRKQKLIDIGLLDEGCPSMQEWDTHIRLSERSTYHLLPIVLCEWRVGGNDTITNDDKRHVDGRLFILSKHQKAFRKYAYRHYMNTLFDLWNRTDNRRHIVKIAPEMLIYAPIKSILAK